MGQVSTGAVSNYSNTTYGSATNVVAYGAVSGGGVVNVYSGGTWSPLSWFAAGEQGAWYDPSDFTTLFQDSAGTIPVTAVEQPVGLMLDKSQSLALGNEIIVNGNFATDTWWTKSAASITIAGGVGVATSAANGEGWYRTGVLTTNTFYEITFTVVSCSSGGFYVWQAGAQTVRSTPGTYTVRVLATQAQVGILCSGVTTGTIDNISYKQVTGNHAFQATAGNRPTLSARVNLLLNTETLSAWVKTGVTTAQQPDGSWQLSAVASSNHQFYQSISTEIGRAHV